MGADFAPSPHTPFHIGSHHASGPSRHDATRASLYRGMLLLRFHLRSLFRRHARHGSRQAQGQGSDAGLHQTLPGLCRHLRALRTLDEPHILLGGHAVPVVRRHLRTLRRDLRTPCAPACPVRRLRCGMPAVRRPMPRNGRRHRLTPDKGVRYAASQRRHAPTGGSPDATSEDSAGS